MRAPLIGLVLAVVLGCPSLAGAQQSQSADPGLYFELRGGAAFLEDANNKGPGITGPINIESEFNTGWVIDGAAGYEHRSGLRGEFALGYRRNDFDRLTIVSDGGVGAFLGVGSLDGLSTGNVGGDVQVISTMANVLFEPQFNFPLRPVVGGGLGAAFIDINASVAGIKIVNDTDTVFAYQAFAGLAYELSDKVSMGLYYNYFATDDPDLEDTGGGNFDSEYRSHSVLFGVRFTR